MLAHFQKRGPSCSSNFNDGDSPTVSSVLLKLSPDLAEDSSEKDPSSSSSSSSLCKRLWNVEFCTTANELVPLQDIARRGPFIGHASIQDPKLSATFPAQQVSRLVIDPVLKYSMEFPFAQPAKVTVSSNTASYLISSVSKRYEPLWTSFYASLCFAGHVINALLNWDDPLLFLDRRKKRTLKFSLTTLALKVARVGRMHPETVFELLREHSNLVIGLLRHQDVDEHIHAAFLAVVNKHLTSGSGWEELQKTLGRSTRDRPSAIQDLLPTASQVAAKTHCQGQKPVHRMGKDIPAVEGNPLPRQRPTAQADCARPPEAAQDSSHSHTLVPALIECLQKPAPFATNSGNSPPKMHSQLSPSRHPDYDLHPDNPLPLPQTEPRPTPIYDPEPPRILRVQLDSKTEAGGSNVLRKCPVCRLSLSNTLDSAIVHLKGHEEQIFRGPKLPTPHTIRISNLRRHLSNASSVSFASAGSLSNLPRLISIPAGRKSRPAQDDAHTAQTESCSPWLEPKQLLSSPQPAPVKQGTKHISKPGLEVRAEHLAAQLKARQSTIANARLLYFEPNAAKKPKTVPKRAADANSPREEPPSPTVPLKCWNCLILLNGSNKKRCLKCKAILL